MSIDTLKDWLENPPKKMPHPHVGKYADYLRKNKIKDIEKGVSSMADMIKEQNKKVTPTASKKTQEVKAKIQQAQEVNTQEIAEKKAIQQEENDRLTEIRIQENITYLKRLRANNFPLNEATRAAAPNPSIYLELALKRLG